MCVRHEPECVGACVRVHLCICMCTCVSLYMAPCVLELRVCVCVCVHCEYVSNRVDTCVHVCIHIYAIVYLRTYMGVPLGVTSVNMCMCVCACMCLCAVIRMWSQCLWRHVGLCVPVCLSQRELAERDRLRMFAPSASVARLWKHR